jgi:hypothetical protein
MNGGKNIMIVVERKMKRSFEMIRRHGGRVREPDATHSTLAEAGSQAGGRTSLCRGPGKRERKGKVRLVSKYHVIR